MSVSLSLSSLPPSLRPRSLSLCLSSVLSVAHPSALSRSDVVLLSSFVPRFLTEPIRTAVRPNAGVPLIGKAK